MKIKIRNVIDHGHETERIVLDVLEDTDIGEYIVFDTTYTKDGNVSNRHKHSYWFPDKKVKKGDVVVLYTKVGTDSEKKHTNGSTIHFFYWRLNSNVWNNDGDAAVVLHVSEWIHYKIQKPKKT